MRIAHMKARKVWAAVHDFFFRFYIAALNRHQLCNILFLVMLPAISMPMKKQHFSKGETVAVERLNYVDSSNRTNELNSSSIPNCQYIVLRDEDTRNKYLSNIYAVRERFTVHAQRIRETAWGMRASRDQWTCTWNRKDTIYCIDLLRILTEAKWKYSP